MKIKELYRRKKQIMVFMAVGAGANIVDVALFNVIYILVGIGAMGFIVANTAAFVITTVIKFIVNGRVTFASKGKLSLFSGLKFLLVSLGSLLLFNSLVYYSLGMFPVISNIVVINVVKLGFGLVAGGMNFLAFRAVVFPVHDRPRGVCPFSASQPPVLPGI